MCGRFTLRRPLATLARQLQLELPDPAPPPRYNIAPTQNIVAVRSSADGPREWALLRWDLTPGWVRDLKKKPLLINARAETVAEKPSFRTSLRRRRCLIPADGYYEWRREGRGKQAYHVRPASGEPFAFAGLWDCWRPAEGPPLESCAIITVGAQGRLADLHERMPAIVPVDGYDAWLDAALDDPAAVLAWLRPFPADELELAAVSSYVNDARHEGPDCLQPA